MSFLPISAEFCRDRTGKINRSGISMLQAKKSLFPIFAESLSMCRILTTFAPYPYSRQNWQNWQKSESTLFDRVRTFAHREHSDSCVQNFRVGFPKTHRVAQKKRPAEADLMFSVSLCQSSMKSSWTKRSLGGRPLPSFFNGFTLMMPCEVRSRSRTSSLSRGVMRSKV